MSKQSRSILKMRRAIDRAIKHTHSVRGASDVRGRLVQASGDLDKIEKKFKERA